MQRSGAKKKKVNMEFKRNQPTQTELMQEIIESMNDGGIQNLKCDFTGWNLAECLSNIYFELKRANDLKEQELNQK